MIVFLDEHAGLGLQHKRRGAFEESLLSHIRALSLFLHKGVMSLIGIEGRAQSLNWQSFHHILQFGRVGRQHRVRHIFPILLVLPLQLFHLFVRDAPSWLYLVESLDLAWREVRKRLLLNLLRSIALAELEVQAYASRLRRCIVDHRCGHEAVLANCAVVDDGVTQTLIARAQRIEASSGLPRI